MVVDPLLEMRRLAGKVAVLFLGIYLLLVYAAIITLFNGLRLPVWKYVALLFAAAPFIPSMIAAIRLHRTTDRDHTKRLWRISLLLAVAGLAPAIAIALVG